MEKWRCITSDLAVLEIVGGYNLDLRCSPVQTALPLCTIQSSEHVEVSNLFFTRPKPDGRIRLILNRKGFNTFVNHVHFKMDSIYSAIRLVTQNCFMASIDLTDAYYSVPIALVHRKLMRFVFRNQLFQFTCLPMGLASSGTRFQPTSLYQITEASLCDVA